MRIVCLFYYVLIELIEFSCFIRYTLFTILDLSPVVCIEMR